MLLSAVAWSRMLIACNQSSQQSISSREKEKYDTSGSALIVSNCEIEHSLHPIVSFY